MRKYFVVSAIVFTGMICGFGFIPLHENQQSGKAASVARGKELYKQYCLTCHQADAGGVPRMTPPLIKTKQILGDKKQLISIVLDGLTGEIEVEDEIYNGTMPPLKSVLKDQQVADVLTYIRNSFTNKASVVTASEVKAVRAKLK